MPSVIENYYPASGGGNNSSLANAWATYKALDPVQAGILSGAYNFVASTVTGVVSASIHPLDAIIGIAKFGYAAAIMPGAFSPMSSEGINLAISIGKTIDKFQTGDTYTKTSMTTEAALTIASFFFGGGEAGGAKAVGEVGWSSKSIKLADIELNRGKVNVWVKSQGEAEELFLGKCQAEGYRNSTGMKPHEAKGFFSYEGIYHWDTEIDPQTGRVKYYSLDDPHGEYPHLQIEPANAPKIRISWPQ